MSMIIEVHPLQDHCTIIDLLQDHNTTIHPLQDHSTTIPPLQDHITIHRIEDAKSMLPDVFNKIGNMPGEYSIILTPIVLPVQHGRHRVPLEAKKRLRVS